MTELTDRMRTCAAFILSRPHDGADAYLSDAANLLLEASNVIEAAPPPLGEPMDIIPPPVPLPAQDLQTTPKAGWTTTQDVRSVPKAVWTTNAGDLPPVPNSRGYRHPRVCPSCDSRATKRVFRHENKVMLACPVCATAWEYVP